MWVYLMRDLATEKPNHGVSLEVVLFLLYTVFELKTTMCTQFIYFLPFICFFKLCVIKSFLPFPRQFDCECNIWRDLTHAYMIGGGGRAYCGGTPMYAGGRIAIRKCQRAHSLVPDKNYKDTIVRLIK